jgi:hypothetical protein
MERLLDYARTESIVRIEGLVLRENKGMLALCQELGFDLQRSDDPLLVKATYDLKRSVA